MIERTRGDGTWIVEARPEARQRLSAYFDFYNRRRLHQSHDYREARLCTSPRWKG